MKQHTKIYLRHFGYDTSDFIPCEVCSAKAVDIHHINARGLGGDPLGKKDVIGNLMAVCRPCHTKYGDNVQYKDFLIQLHLKRMNR